MRLGKFEGHVERSPWRIGRVRFGPCADRMTKGGEVKWDRLGAMLELRVWPGIAIELRYWTEFAHDLAVTIEAARDRRAVRGPRGGRIVGPGVPAHHNHVHIASGRYDDPNR